MDSKSMIFLMKSIGKLNCQAKEFQSSQIIDFVNKAINEIELSGPTRSRGPKINDFLIGSWRKLNCLHQCVPEVKITNIFWMESLRIFVLARPGAPQVQINDYNQCGNWIVWPVRPLGKTHVRTTLVFVYKAAGLGTHYKLQTLIKSPLRNTFAFNLQGCESGHSLPRANCRKESPLHYTCVDLQSFGPGNALQYAIYKSR